MRHYVVTYNVETSSLEHAPDEATAVRYVRAVNSGKVISVVAVQDVTKDYNRAVKG